jgi:hypothetical protein
MGYFIMIVIKQFCLALIRYSDTPGWGFAAVGGVLAWVLASPKGDFKIV